MFCARCGQQIPDASDVCPLCGQPANFHLPHQPLATDPARFAQPAAASLFTRPINEQLRGVGGWLVVFCIYAGVLIPLGSLRDITAHLSAPTIWTLYHLGFVCFSLVVGLFVWQASPSALPILRAYFLSVAAIEVLSIAYLQWTQDHIAVMQIVFRVRTLIWVGIWYAYFYKSERVRATFGRNL